MALLPHRPFAHKLPQKVCYTVHSNLKSRLIRARISKQLFCAPGSKHCTPWLFPNSGLPLPVRPSWLPAARVTQPGQAPGSRSRSPARTSPAPVLATPVTPLDGSRTPTAFSPPRRLSRRISRSGELPPSWLPPIRPPAAPNSRSTSPSRVPQTPPHTLTREPDYPPRSAPWLLPNLSPPGPPPPAPRRMPPPPPPPPQRSTAPTK